jgi:hypothetical protein
MRLSNPFKKIWLNDGEPTVEVGSREMAARLKSGMTTLKGAFIEPGRGRVAYERMQQSDIYQNFLKLSSNLKNLDLAVIAGREEKIPFWINLYNVLVIHGVIALGVRDSVKEVWNFFRRVHYQIGEHFFSPEDIEHGILRANRRPPYSLLRRFRAGDPRLNFIVEPLDPRIHFTLVCGSSSCPFIDVYTPENLEEELNIAAAAFLNGGGVIIDRERHLVSLSRIFKWYGRDFGFSQVERLRFIAPYLTRDEDRKFIDENAGTLKVVYQKYDWRLNRD